MLASRQSSSLRRRRLNVIMTSWHKLIKGTREGYKPELHYMRGPGPKWHAKHRAREENAL